MYKVLLADDEQIIREGLRVLMDWESLGLKLIAEAENGKIALELIEKHKPHVVITDVKMPVMGGLELIREINAKGLNIKIIIISGYDDFAYIKEALKYGVSDYILKPVRESDLASILKEVVKDIDSRITRDINSSESERLIKTNLFNRLINNSVARIEFLEKTRFLNIAISDKPYRIMNVEVDGINSLSGPELEYRRFSLNNVCEELFEKYKHTIIFYDRSNRLIIIINDSEMDEDIINFIAAKIRDCVSKFLGFSVTIGIGCSIDNIMEICKSYNESIIALKQKFIYGKGTIIFYSYKWNKQSEEIAEAMPDTEKIEQSIRQLNREKTVEEVRKFFASFKKGIFNKTSIDQKCIDLFFILLSILKEYGGKSDNIPCKEEIFDTISSSETIEDIEKFIITFTERVIEYLSNINEEKQKGIIGKVINYTKENYRKNITLKSVARHFYMNTAYLGRIFKEETGESFSEFVNRARIEEASKMLIASDYKIYEVAYRCGYKDIDYFRSTFKKQMGENPAEFKRRI